MASRAPAKTSRSRATTRRPATASAAADDVQGPPSSPVPPKASRAHPLAPLAPLPAASTIAIASKSIHCDREGAARARPHAEIDLAKDGRLPYDSRAAKALEGLNKHHGQRKLLLSEIQLLTEHYRVKANKDKHPLLAYVGSAPGTHLLFLHRLFPRVRFVLWDGAPFDPRLRTDAPPGVFELRNEFFDDRVCRQLLEKVGSKSLGGQGGAPLIFVCDIRSSEPDPAKFEARVMLDMLAQKRWVETLRPALSLLKFRLPFTLRAGDVVTYLRGKLLYGIWPPPTSAETRLLVKRADVGHDKDVAYDYAAYEQVLYHHNAVTRRTCFSPKSPQGAVLAGLVAEGAGSGYDFCFDCLSELSVFAEYLKVCPAEAREPPVAAAPAGPNVPAVHTPTPPAPLRTRGEIVRAYAVHAALGTPRFHR